MIAQAIIKTSISPQMPVSANWSDILQVDTVIIRGEHISRTWKGIVLTMARVTHKTQFAGALVRS